MLVRAARCFVRGAFLLVFVGCAPGCSLPTPGTVGKEDPTTSSGVIDSDRVTGEEETSGQGALPPGVPATYHADMAYQAESMNLTDPPAVTPIRAVDQDEFDQVQVDCLMEHGVDAQLEPSGGFSYESGLGQEDATNLAHYTCLGRYPMHERYGQQFTPEQLEIYYAWMVEKTIPCMESLGYPTPVPPTKETFVANYEARGELFFPDTELDPSTIAGDMMTIMEQCEVMPPDDEFYG